MPAEFEQDIRASRHAIEDIDAFDASARAFDDVLIFGKKYYGTIELTYQSCACYAQNAVVPIFVV